MVSNQINQPLISCIIIFLNGEKFIEETIASIFAQTYKNWELLLVDDGSTDNSSAIAQNYAKQYPDKICYLEHPNHQNQGMSATRNLGISQAKGEYIGFLDADDIWLPEKLAEQLTILARETEAAMVYGRTQIWYSWNQKVTTDHPKDFFYDLGVTPNTLIKPPQLFIQLLENKYQTPTTCNALIRRAVFEKVGMFEKDFPTMYEDQVFFSKVLLERAVFVSDQCWAKYRQHPDSCSESADNQKYYETRKRFLHWLDNYLTSKQVSDPQIWQVFQKELWQSENPFWANLLNSPLIYKIQYKIKYYAGILIKGKN
jgi:glycosyltransferase involved in cell wall biosynthesis